MTTSYQDPFEEYKQRLAKRLAKNAEGASEKPKAVVPGDSMNWFGEKVGAAAKDSAAAGGGVGKYLSLGKLPAPATPSAPAPGSAAEQTKKRKIGFGDFESW